MGKVVICQTLPMLPLVLVGGAIVDRFNRVRIMLYSDLARGVVTSCIAFLAVTHHLEIWHLYIAAMVFGFFDAFFQPAYTAVVPSVVPAEDRPSANSLSVLSERLMSIAGPLCGAMIVSLGGTPLAFIINATTFFISAACLVPLLRLHLTPNRDEEGSAGVFADMREGLAFVTSEPWLWISILNSAFLNATNYAAFAIALPYLITQTLNYDAGTLGTIESVFSVGMVGAALWLGHRGRLPRRGWVLYGFSFGSGLCTFLMGLPVTIYGIAVIAFARGIVISFIGLVWTNLVQEKVPMEKLGRVASIDWLGSELFMPVGFAVIGWSTDHASAPLVFVTVGAISMLVVAISLLHPRIRAID